jgi:hypothetical protein
MKDCPNCGTENRDQALYCRKCGERMSQSIYVKPKESLSIVHIGVLLLSVILLITSFGLLMGGTTLRSIQSLVVDEDGFITSDPATIDLQGYAIVLEDIEFNGNPMVWSWLQNRGGLLKLKIITESTDPGKEIFIGVARESDLSSYLQDVEYQSIVDMDFDEENYDLVFSADDFKLHPGGPPSAPPTYHSYWVVHTSSANEQELIWEPLTGTYNIVIMNADGSEGIDAEIQVGISVPFFGSISGVLIYAGLFVGAIGGLMIYFTLKRPQP